MIGNGALKFFSRVEIKAGILVGPEEKRLQAGK
jgi:hypothetical protein